MDLQPMSSQNPHNNELFIFIFILAIFFFFLFFVYFIKLRSSWCNCDICRAYLTSSWTKDFKNLQDWYTFLLRNSPTKTIHIHILNNTITANPFNVEYMLKTNFNNYPKGKAFSMILGDLLGRGIFNVDGESWRFQRKMASLELDNMAIRSYGFDIVREEIEGRLLPMLASIAGKNDAVLDLQDVFRRFTFDMICRFSFGIDPECLEISLPISKFATSFDLASKLSAERAMNVSPLIWKAKRALNVGSEKQLRQAIQVVNALANEVIRQRRKLGFYNNQNDLLSRFMLKVNDERYLRDIIVSFLLAGRDTVASALTGFFHLIGTHRAVVSKILEEVDRVIGPGQALAGFTKLREMHYLNAAVHEAMRLYPPVQFDSKFSLDDDVMPDGSFIRWGTRVTYHSYAMGRMEDIWGPDCMEFRPERWLGGPNGSFLQECPFKYPVYQGGVRVCIGKEVSLMVAKSVILSMLREYRVELAEPARVGPIFSPGLTANFRGGLSVLVHKRNANDKHAIPSG